MSKQNPAEDYSMSDATRRSIDEEQQFITDQAHRRALALLAENRSLLDALAALLLEREVLEREDLDQLVAADRDAVPAPERLRPMRA